MNVGTDKILYVDRHGSDSPAVLLAKLGFWRLSSAGNKIRMDGSGVYAFYLVGHPDSLIVIPPSANFPQRDGEQDELDHPPYGYIAREASGVPPMDILRFFRPCPYAYISIHRLSHPFW
jgi:hypothetical protein